MKIVMVGTGYVGLVSGVCFAEFGFDVTCVDVNPAIVERLNKGQVTIFEPGLDELMERNVREGRLAFSGELAKSVRGADVVFLAVGTPSRRGDGEADLQYIEAAADEVADSMKPETVVVIKSTVVVGTNRRISERIRPSGGGFDYRSVGRPLVK